VQAKFNELKTRLQEITDLHLASNVLYWDQATYMPPGGAEARGRQLAMLNRLSHEKFTDPAIGKLLDQLQQYGENLPYDSDEASLLRVTRREYERAIKVPSPFVSEMSSHSAATFSAWTKARPANDFAAIRPYLEKTLELSRRYADFFPGYKHIADPLIAQADYGMSAATIMDVFATLRKELVPLVRAITEQEPADDSCLHQFYPESKQKEFGEQIIRQFGYDFNRGRQDKTHHPFMIKFSLGDVRITTRFDEHNLGDGLYSTLHEAGHALYEQGIARNLEGTPLATGTSAGVHESQSRLWENMVGRSRAFWRYYYPKIQSQFPQQLGNVSEEEFYRAVNKVQRSLIRVDADEVTYNLHVMMRFDFELKLLEGTLDIADLPDAWRDRMRNDLGVEPLDDRDGVLQDVHWYSGPIGGAFQGYTLGNIMSALFFDAAVQAHPEIPEDMERGQFDTLRGWLTDNIYRHGMKFTTSELVERVTGQPLTIKPYINYLKHKYGELYRLEL
jgi:carboxypeptidase Taq